MYTTVTELDTGTYWRESVQWKSLVLNLVQFYIQAWLLGL